jgi:hypothetical protein
MRGSIGSWLLTVFLLVPCAARAQGEPAPASPDEVTTGEVRIHLSSDYAKLLVDGEAWDEAVFEDDGRLLIIHLLPRTVEHEITLTPIYGKKEKVWRVEKKITFPKAAPQPSAPSPAPAGN